MNSIFQANVIIITFEEECKLWEEKEKDNDQAKLHGTEVSDIPLL